MPELSDSSTPPTPPVTMSPVSIAYDALLHDHDQPLPSHVFPWENHPAFRFTFLMNFTQEGDREAFEHLGNLFYNMALECSDKWPDWPETPTKAEMRTVALDLRHAGAFLLSVGEERNRSSLSSEDESFSYMATTWGHMVARIADAIESVLPPIRGEKAP